MKEADDVSRLYNVDYRDYHSSPLENAYKSEDSVEIITDVDRIRARYERIRNLDFQIFNTNTDILDAQRRVNSALKEVALLQASINELEIKKKEEFAVIRQIVERNHGDLKIPILEP